MTSGQLKIAALGRPFTLGMLYDARSDALIPGFTLWDINTLQENTAEKPQPSTYVDFTKSDTIESKSSLLDVNASLKASFLSGLIEVGGSAKYLNDQKKFKNQSRVAFKYKAKTNFKQLSMTELKNLNEQQKDVLEKSSATHVVTGITYGANAIFVFDSKKLDASSVQDIEGSMEAVIKKIPSLDIEGSIDLKLTEEEKALTNTFSCKFFGDLLLESNPATFADAVKTYVELPKLLGEKKENSVPLEVWLMPLTTFGFNTAVSNEDIAKYEILKTAQDAQEQFREIEIRCNESLADSVSDNFPQIRKSLRSFQRQCNNYTSELQQTMAKTVISIREGKADTSSLTKLLHDRVNSPFSEEKLNDWMKHKEREINVIRSCVDMLEGTNTKIVPNQSELDEEVLARGVEDALCFVFTSLESADPCFDAMKNYLHTHEIRSTDANHWYFSNEVFTNMREKASDFHDLAKPLKNSSTVRFLATATANEKYKGATIYHYNQGIRVTDDFSRPAVPHVESITDKTALMWYACDISLNPKTAYNYLLLSGDNKKVTRGEWQQYPDHPARFDYCYQVLCKQGLTGRHYWEVELSDGYNEDKAVGVAYKHIPRKLNKGSYLGYNAQSWVFCVKSTELFTGYNYDWQYPSLPSTGLKRVGVYLDWRAGTLSFYNVSSNKLSHIFTFNAQFTRPVYPGCYIYSNTGSLSFAPVK